MEYCGKADTAKENTSQEAAREKVQIAVLGSYGEEGKIKIDELNENLKKIEGLTYLNNPINDINKIQDLNEDRIVVVDGYEVTIHKEGKNVTVGDYLGNIPKDTPKADGSWNEEKGVNSPNLMDNTMKAVYWEKDENGKQQEVVGDVKENWYQYVAGDNNTDTRTSHWANAKTEDGSYWVWIPRYEYKILSGEGTSTAGKIEVKFIPTEQTVADEGYKIHPAFQDGKANNYKRGEWDSELSGIWVAKFEMSMETNGVHTETSSAEIGDVLTKNAGNTANIRAVSKPNVSSWTGMSVGKAYENSLHYAREKESHLMKNSEWGVVVYLAHSQYGRNGHQIMVNNSSNFITGNAANSMPAKEEEGIINAYDTDKGGLASSTGNIFGIYDLSGGAWDAVSAYISNGNDSLVNGNSFAKTIADAEGYKKWNNKYATVYPYDATKEDNFNNYTAYKNANYGYGDTILEAASKETNSFSSSWFQAWSSYANNVNPFFWI